MSLLVTQDCLDLGLRAGTVILRNLRVTNASAALRAEIAREAQALQTALTGAAVLALPELVEFQEILRKVGVDSRRIKPSVERLLQYALNKTDLPHVNGLVDAYNLVSLRSRCSLGAHDLDRISLPVSLRLMTGAESFTPLGAVSATAIAPGEYGYVDAANRVLCRLDILQAEFSKVTAGTVNAFLIIEGTTGHSADWFEKTLAAAVAAITRECGGQAEIVAVP